jgi:hypothetical protein
MVSDSSLAVLEVVMSDVVRDSLLAGLAGVFAGGTGCEVRGFVFVGPLHLRLLHQHG